MGDFWSDIPDKKNDDFWSTIPDKTGVTPGGSPGAVTGLEKLGGIPPPISRPSIPGRLSRPDSLMERAAEYGDIPADMMMAGGRQVGRGVKTLAKAKIYEAPKVLQGANDVVEGGMDALAPIAIPLGAASAPLATGLALGVGSVAGAGTTKAMEGLGASPEASRLGGNVAGLVAGGYGAKLGNYLEHIPSRIVSPSSTPAPIEPPPSSGPERPDLHPPSFDEPTPSQPSRPSTFTIPPRPRPSYPTPTGLDNAIRNQEQLGPVAATIPRRLTGTTPYQEGLVDRLGPTQAGLLPSNLQEAQPAPSPGGAPGLPPPRPIQPVNIVRVADGSYAEGSFPWKPVEPGDPRIAAYESGLRNLDQPQPTHPIPPIEDRGPGHSPTPESSQMVNQGLRPEAGPQGPLAEPAYTAPTTPAPVPNPSPEPPPPVVHTPPTPPPPPAVSAIPPPAQLGTTAGFTTAKGSQYRIEGQGTSRSKTATGERFGASDQTIYVTPDVNQRVMETLQAENAGNAKASIRLLSDGQIGIVVKDRVTGKVLNDRSRIIPTVDQPAMGLHPIELWHKNPETGEYGYHVGHAITDISTDLPVGADKARPSFLSDESGEMKIPASLSLSSIGSNLKALGTRARESTSEGLAHLGDLYDQGAARESYPAARRIADTVSQARTAIVRAMPQIHEAMQASGMTKENFLATLAQSRLTGRKGWYSKTADILDNAKPKELEKMWGDWGKTAWEAFDNVTGGHETEKVTEALANDQHAKAGKYMARMFRYLASPEGVKDIDLASQTGGKTFDEITADPNFQRALSVYKREIEPVLSESHKLQDGYETELGPLNTYYPLTKLREATDSSTNSWMNVERAGLESPEDPLNHFTTGLAKNYDFSVKSLTSKMATAIKRNGVAGLLTSLKEEGLADVVQPGDKITPPTILGHTYAPSELVKGQIGTPTKVKVNGKYVNLPKPVMILPKDLAREFQMKWTGPKDGIQTVTDYGIFDFSHGRVNSDSLISHVADSAISLQLAGPAEGVLHTHAIARGMLSGTPFLGDSLLDRTIGNVPVAKMINAAFKIKSPEFMGDTNSPIAPENSALVQEMAKNGYLHSRTFSGTLSKEISDATGIEHLPANNVKTGMGNIMHSYLFGPQGVDTRVRIAMAKVFKSGYPEVPFDSPAAARFMSQVIDYNKLTQPQIAAAIRNSPLGRLTAPFISAGIARVTNGLRQVTGVGALPGPSTPTNVPGRNLGWTKATSRRMEQQMASGVAGAIVTSILASRAATGQWPWEDPNYRLGKIQVPDGIRTSKFGKVTWGDNDKPAYVDLQAAYPSVIGGAKTLGIPNAFDAYKAGGDGQQIAEEVAKGGINSAMSSLGSGPLPHALLALGGYSPFIQSLSDPDTGKAMIQPRRSIRTPATLGESARLRVGAFAKGLNPLVEPGSDMMAWATDSPTMPEPDEDRGSKVLQYMLKFILPGAFTPAYDMSGKQDRLARQQLGRARTVAREDERMK